MYKLISGGKCQRSTKMNESSYEKNFKTCNTVYILILYQVNKY